MKPTTYKKYLIAILLVTLAFNQQDRWALALVLQDIKREYVLSDAQLGLLTGLAFALFYSVMGIPLARWADRGNRITILGLTVALWSFMVSLCGLATSFAQLLLIRTGAAVGEAGCMPTAHSLIPDYFTRAERPRATAIFLLGFPVSLVTGSFLAGWLNEIYGWRVMFFLLGLPGLGLAALALDRPGAGALGGGRVERCVPVLGGPGVPAVCVTSLVPRLFLGGLAFVASQ